MQSIDEGNRFAAPSRNMKAFGTQSANIVGGYGHLMRHRNGKRRIAVKRKLLKESWQAAQAEEKPFRCWRGIQPSPAGPNMHSPWDKHCQRDSLTRSPRTTDGAALCRLSLDDAKR